MFTWSSMTSATALYHRVNEEQELDSFPFRLHLSCISCLF